MTFLMWATLHAVKALGFDGEKYIEGKHRKQSDSACCCQHGGNRENRAACIVNAKS